MQEIENNINTTLNQLIKKNKPLEKNNLYTFTFYLKKRKCVIEQEGKYKQIKYKIPETLKYYMKFEYETCKIIDEKSGFWSAYHFHLSNRVYLNSYGFYDIETKNNFDCLSDIDITLENISNREDNLSIYNFMIYESYSFEQCIKEIYKCEIDLQYIYEWIPISFFIKHNNDAVVNIVIMNFNKYSKFYGKIIVCDVKYTRPKRVVKQELSNFRLVANNMCEFIELVSNIKNFGENESTLLPKNIPMFKMNYDRELMILIILERKKNQDFIFCWVPIDILKIIWEFIKMKRNDDIDVYSIIDTLIDDNKRE